MSSANDITFDPGKAMRYSSRLVVKQAVFVPAAEDDETTIMVSWNNDGNYEPQRIKGPWYLIYTLGGVSNFYGTPKQNFEETHSPVEGVENGYAKITWIDAYQYDGPVATVTTTMGDGTIERAHAPIKAGDWFVRWPHGEIAVRPNDEGLSKLYNLDAPAPLPANETEAA